LSIKSKNHTTTCDVLLVGAGPAGVTAAKELVKNGYRVTVIERKKLPRYKICSGLILDRAQDLLAEHFDTPPDDVFCNPAFLKGAFPWWKGNSLTKLPLNKPQVYNVWRSAFDVGGSSNRFQSDSTDSHAPGHERG
jgi:menaquinone-9 beta-reductase